ncbi:MAG TPA: hypothetical protein VLE99_01970 [Candidatus Saccharimonadales bacterium]|nr:hypothetical protein [Candidatus Saccharimonadales bacterium]
MPEIQSGTYTLNGKPFDIGPLLDKLDLAQKYDAKIPVPEAASALVAASERVVTTRATDAHLQLVRIGMAHVNGRDSCAGTLMESPSNLGLCLDYMEADAAYSALQAAGERGSCH